MQSGLINEVRETIFDRTWVKLSHSSLVEKPFLGAMPPGQLMNMGPLDFLILAHEDRKYINFDKDDAPNPLEVILFAQEIFKEVEKGLTERATGVATGFNLINEFSDMTAWNSQQFPATIGFLAHLTYQINQSEALSEFVDIPPGSTDDERIALIVQDLDRRLVYEYLRDGDVKYEDEDPNWSLNKLITRVLGLENSERTKMLPDATPTMEALVKYSFVSAFEFAKKGRKPEPVTGEAYKQINLANGEIVNKRETPPKDMRIALEHLLLKLTGKICIPDIMSYYFKVARHGPDDEFNKDLKYLLATEEITETHEAVHKLARSMKGSYYITPSGQIAIKVKCGFYVGEYILNNNNPT